MKKNLKIDLVALKILIQMALPQEQCRNAATQICQSALGRADYQLGRTKVFLKDAQDLFLEQERDRVLTKKIQVLQRCIRGWYHRRRFLKMRAAAIVIQKNFRYVFSPCLYART